MTKFFHEKKKRNGKLAVLTEILCNGFSLKCGYDIMKIEQGLRQSRYNSRVVMVTA